MENSFQTSFIPKKPITSGTTTSGKEPTNFFSLITGILLVIAILASAGLFVYKMYLTKQKDTLSASLLVNRDSFEQGTIDELALFNRRTDSAKQILSNHVVLSPLFALLGDITIPQVQYTNFDQQIDDKGIITVNMSGIALDYRSIAIQADVFNGPKGSSLTNVLFSNLVKDKNNNVSFNLKFNVNPELISYEKNNLLEQSDSTSTPTPTSTTPTTIPPTTPTTPTTNTIQTPTITTNTPTVQAVTPSTIPTTTDSNTPLSQGLGSTQ